MKLQLVLSAALLASTLLPSQSQVAIPTGHSLETTEGFDQFAKGWGGASYTLFFGAYADQRHQLICDELTGKGIKIMKSLGFRHDYKSFSASNGTGRTWSNVTVTMGEQTYSSFGNNFASNLAAATNVVQVFSNSASWPTQTGNPTSKPAPWGIAGLTFPFGSVWVYTARAAILQEFVFQNGTLANNGAWGGSTRVGYDLDSVFTTLSFGQYAGGPTVTNCADSAFTPSTSIYAQEGSYLAVYSKLYAGPKANTMEWNITSYYTAPGKPVIHGISLGAPGNINLGAKCNPLYIHPVLHVLIPNVAGTDARATATRITLGAPRSAVPFGTRITAQTAWQDSITGQFGLTSARDHTITASVGVSDTLPIWQGLMASNRTSATGSLISAGSPYYNPITLYTY